MTIYLIFLLFQNFFTFSKLLKLNNWLYLYLEFFPWFINGSFNSGAELAFVTDDSGLGASVLLPNNSFNVLKVTKIS